MARTTKRRFQPALDALDPRRLMAAHVTATLFHGVLTVKGTGAADLIAVNVQDPARGNRGGAVTIEGVRKSFRAAQVKRIDVFGGAGDDTISVRGRLAGAARIDGGAGNDVINGVSEMPPVTQPTVVAPQVPAPTPGSIPTSPIEQRIVDLTNAERVKAGLAPLASSGPLMQAAKIQSGNMATLDVMAHVLPGTAQPNLTDRAAAVGYAYSTLGENIAYNYPDADAVVAGWMNSPGHRANILEARYTEIGVSVAYNAHGDPYYTQVFGRPA